MSSSLFYTAQLDQPTMDDLQELEIELGVTLVAMESNPTPVATQLSDSQLERIQTLEGKSGKVLLAYN
jgi:hypothetical protein